MSYTLNMGRMKNERLQARLYTIWRCSNNNLGSIYSLEVFYHVNSWKFFMISMYSATVKMVILFAVKINFCWCKAISEHCFFVFNVWVLLFLIKFVDTKYLWQWQGKNSFLGHQKVHAQKRSQISPLNQKATPATILTSSISAKNLQILDTTLCSLPSFRTSSSRFIVLFVLGLHLHA